MIKKSQASLLVPSYLESNKLLTSCEKCKIWLVSNVVNAKLKIVNKIKTSSLEIKTPPSLSIMPWSDNQSA